MRPRLLRSGLSVTLCLAAAVLCSTVSTSAAPPRRARPTAKPQPKPAPKKPLPRVQQVDPNTIGSVRGSAGRIDKYVEANYAKYNVEPNPLTTDEQFVRRIYLDITGTIPTMEQAEAFLSNPSRDKREKLIDTLLNSYGYVSHYYNYWGDILRLQNRPNNNIYSEAYLAWIKQSLQNNTPYDEWVREMLTATGKIWENPAAGYMLRDDGMPLNHLSNTVRVFLGTQIGCAQCHDHPFDKWTQREFYELAAYTYGTQTRANQNYPGFGGKNYFGIMNKKIRESGRERGEINQMNRISRANSYALYDLPRKLKYPHDYAYDDAQPNSVVAPKVLFGYVSASNKATPREQFADWLTARENPRFTKAIVNRLWQKLFGMAQIEPVDDIQDASVPENPELMTYLESTMQRVDYDLKEFLRILYNTETYQRQATAGDLDPTATYHFPGPLLRRMTAEQAWDSFLTLAVVDPYEYRATPIAELNQLIDADLMTVSLDELQQKGQKFNELYNGKQKREREKKYTYKGTLLGRASELPLPAPAGHFLRQFGQGDRESIDGGEEDGSVTQVLTMFNGPVTHMLLEEGSTMYNNVVSQKSVNDQIDAIFLTILSRKPTPVERQIASGEIRSGGRGGYGNVIWALVNTREFIFIQ